MGTLLASDTLLAQCKRLTPVLVFLAMLVPAAANALGLGNIEMKSALNQPLHAEIELLSVQRGDLTNLTVKLGSEEDFKRVGADRAFFLTKIKFEVKRRKDGKAYVELRTTDTVTEPFLDFVVEARWPRGRILREFTVLVDPPVLSDAAPAQVQQAAVAAQPAPAPAPAQAAPQSTRSAPIRSRAELAPVTRQQGELTYGPVKRNDTLYEIANAMRPSSVSVDQMMLALVRSNPNAFYNGNINQLKAGYVLRVTDPAELDAYSAAQAKAEVNRQHQEWRDRKSGKLVAQADAPTGGRVARGGEAAGGSRAADETSLKLVAPGSQGAGSGAGDENVDQLRQDLLLAAEALDANRQETDELKARLAEMEEQLESMQRLIMLKDDELMALQKQTGVEPTEQPAEEPMAEAMTEEAAEMPAEATEEPAEAMSEEASALSGGEAPAEEMAEEAAAPAPEPAPAPAPAAMEEPGLLDDPMVMYGGLGVLVLIIIAVVVQRRRKMQDGFEESILNVGGSNAGATAEDMSGGESSMVSDFAMSEMSGMSGIEADAADVDPISEADVYLAYGRHQQAEEILKEALEKEPERNEIKFKLLEVYFAAKDAASFEQHAQELHASLGDESDPMWAKTVTMGTQLCPTSDLFGGASAEALKEDLQEDAGASDDDLLDFDFDLDADSADTGEATAEAEADTSLDFDMDMGGETEALAEEPVAEPAAETAEADNSLDFDVSSLDFDLDTGAAGEEAGSTAEAETSEDTGLDFDLGDMGETAEAGEEVAAEADDGLGDLGDDLGDELGEDAFGEVDEIGTKLDLAKAYVDMGDGDGAKSILDEVMEEGDDDQKKQAEELLAQIS